jgi:glycosyltransferase involved in cell wall biosynthesis
MACGVIPIVNPVGGLGEIVKHQVNGLVLQYEDKNHHAESNYEASTEIPAEMNEAISSILTAIITGDLTRGNLRAEARKTAEDYDWSSIFAKTEDYYDYLGA